MMDTAKLVKLWMNQMFVLVERSTSEEYKAGIRAGIRYCYRSLRRAERSNKSIAHGRSPRRKI